MFKKTIFAFGLLMAASAMAASTYTTIDAGAVQSYEQHPRMKFYGDNRNALSADGEILVCPQSKTVTYDGKCVDNTRGSANSWVRLETDAPAGYVVSAYEFRQAGSTGTYRNLYVYYKKVRAQ